MASNWPSFEKHLYTSKSKPDVYHLAQVQAFPQPTFCTVHSFLFPLQHSPPWPRCNPCLWHKLEDATTWTSTSSVSSTYRPVRTLRLLRQPHQATGPQLGTSTQTTLSQDSWCLLSFASSPFWRRWGMCVFFAESAGFKGHGGSSVLDPELWWEMSFTSFPGSSRELGLPSAWLYSGPGAPGWAFGRWQQQLQKGRTATGNFQCHYVVLVFPEFPCGKYSAFFFSGSCA